MNIQEKIQTLLTNPLVTKHNHSCFYLVVLDKSKPAFFVNALKVDTASHVAAPLENIPEPHDNDSKLRPSVLICDGGCTTHILSWNLNREKQRIVIRQKHLPNGPVFFYNVGESEIAIGYRDGTRQQTFQSFVVAPGEAIADPLNPAEFYDPVHVLKDEYKAICRRAKAR